MTMTIYEAPGFSRCAWTIKELDARLEVRALTTIAAMKPSWAGQLHALDAELQAVLEEDEQILSDPAAICTYLADKYASRGLIAKPGSWQRAMHDEWCSDARGLEQLLMSSGSLSDRAVERSTSGTSSLAVAAITEHNALEFRKMARRLDRFLEHATYLIPNGFSVTDIVVSHVLNWADMNRLLDELRHCREYLDRIKMRPTCLLTRAKRGG